jgi:acetyltransferase
MERNPKRAEFSIVVRDAWQGKGIGAALLKHCLTIAYARGVEEIWGTVLAENIQMLALGRKFGFRLKRESGLGEYELRIDLSRKPPAFLERNGWPDSQGDRQAGRINSNQRSQP